MIMAKEWGYVMMVSVFMAAAVIMSATAII